MKYSRQLGTHSRRNGAWLVLAVAMGCGSAPGTVGAVLGKRTDNRVFVREVPEGQGADRAGLRVDDEILLLDGENVATLSPDEIRRAVRGDVGSALVLTVLRGTQKLEVRVLRSPLLAEKRK